MDKKEHESILKAGKIAVEVRKHAIQIIKKGEKLLDIAEKIEAKIIELGGKPAFPVNLCINEMTAHYTPSYNDETLASGLLKVDFGVSVDGWVSDNAFSLDLENSKENKKLIEASELGLKEALGVAKKGVVISQIGKAINEKISSCGFSPIVNLSGHSMEQYNLHAGITIPNIDDKKQLILEKGLYAIEPFATAGAGKVHDGKPSGIFALSFEKSPRSQTAREVLNYIAEEYQTLPFCSRWLFKKFGARALLALRELKEQDIVYEYPQLVEDSKSKVSQAEHTILVEEKTIITTE